MITEYMDLKTFFSYQGKTLPQINPAYLRVTSQFLWRTRTENPSLVDDVGPIRHRQSFADVMIGDQDPDPASPKIGDDFLQIQNGDWIDARKRLVQQNKRRVDAERTRDFDSPPFSARQRVTTILPDVFQSQ